MRLALWQGTSPAADLVKAGSGTKADVVASPATRIQASAGFRLRHVDTFSQSADLRLA